MSHPCGWLNFVFIRGGDLASTATVAAAAALAIVATFAAGTTVAATIAALREKYDLHMTVERYTPADQPETVIINIASRNLFINTYI